MAAGARCPPKLNFLVSDGLNLAASCWGNTLYWTHRSAVPDCAVCGLSHCDDVDERYWAIAIASKPITDEHWMEVQEGSVLSVDRSAILVTRELLAPAASPDPTCRTNANAESSYRQRPGLPPRPHPALQALACQAAQSDW